MLVAGGQLDKLRRDVGGRRAVALRLHALARFGAQFVQRGNHLGRVGQGGLRDIAQLLDGAHAGRQQVAHGQLRQLKVGVLARQAFGLRQCLAPPAFAGQLVHLQQPRLGLPVSQCAGRHGGCRLGCSALGGGR